MKVEDYKVIRAWDVHELNRGVKKLIEKGWEPYCELKINDNYFYQPMIKYKYQEKINGFKDF